MEWKQTITIQTFWKKKQTRCLNKNYNYLPFRYFLQYYSRLKTNERIYLVAKMKQCHFTWSRSSTGAPASSNDWTHSVWPLAAAQCSAVSPSWKANILSSRKTSISAAQVKNYYEASMPKMRRAKMYWSHFEQKNISKWLVLKDCYPMSNAKSVKTCTTVDSK